MTHGTFIWADLSTFRIDQTSAYYEQVLGWKVTDGLASNAAGPVAALFTMPEKFQKIGMPSFWLSYIAVDNLDGTVETANSLGGKVELGPEPFEQGRIALIRDPLGAGFTVYQGPDLQGTSAGPGARVGHGLFVSDLSVVTPFYNSLFGWSFGALSDGVSVVTRQGQAIFHTHEIPDPAIRGKEEYWGVFFGCSDLSAASANVEANGGRVLTEVALPEGPALLAQDTDGGTFFLLSAPGAVTQSSGSTSLPWKAGVGIALVLVSSLTAQLWPWAIFLGFWIIEALRNGETYLLERITRRHQPKTFWSITLLYLCLLALVVLLESERFIGTV